MDKDGAWHLFCRDNTSGNGSTTNVISHLSSAGTAVLASGTMNYADTGSSGLILSEAALSVDSSGIVHVTYDQSAVNCESAFMNCSGTVSLMHRQK